MKQKHDYLTDDQVEKEIAQLKLDPDVILAKTEERIRTKRRQYLYCLRSMKKRGMQLRNNPEYAWLIDMLEQEQKGE